MAGTSTPSWGPLRQGPFEFYALQALQNEHHPVGVDGLSPQTDKIISQKYSRSPVGSDPLDASPQHMEALFRPPSAQSEFHRSLSPAPPQPHQARIPAKGRSRQFDPFSSSFSETNSFVKEKVQRKLPKTKNSFDGEPKSFMERIEREKMMEEAKQTNNDSFGDFELFGEFDLCQQFDLQLQTKEEEMRAEETKQKKKHALFQRYTTNPFEDERNKTEHSFYQRETLSPFAKEPINNRRARIPSYDSLLQQQSQTLNDQGVSYDTWLASQNQTRLQASPHSLTYRRARIPSYDSLLRQPSRPHSELSLSADFELLYGQDSAKEDLGNGMLHYDQNLPLPSRRSRIPSHDSFFGLPSRFSTESSKRTKEFERALSPTSQSFTPSSPREHTTSPREHPYGEHPSRTLFVRNIHSSVDDDELSALFEKAGDICSMYTQCKHRGFVMISYYDIRHAKEALKSLQGSVLHGRMIDIHYSIPKDNPSEKDANHPCQGTVVAFNLPKLPRQTLLDLFQEYGAVMMIRGNPKFKFVEYYDIRDAEAAIKGLNNTEVNGHLLNVEPARMGVMKHKQQAQRPYGFGASLSHYPNQHAHASDPRLSNFMARPVTKFPGYSRFPRPYTLPNAEPANSHNYPASFSTMHGVTDISITPPDQYCFSAPARSTQFLSGNFVPETLTNERDTAFRCPSVQQPLLVMGRITIHSTGPELSVVSRQRQPEPEGDEYRLDIEKCITGQETRTTLMIRNIPNKYSQKLLLNAVDKNHKGVYDFFYLPIDWKNKCNVGYAFINFIHPKSIVPFYQQFQGKRWQRFNSEKICAITFARIQGKEALIANWQNSSLMCEDRRCRPIIFHSDGADVGEVEPFPVTNSSEKEGSGIMDFNEENEN